MLCGSLQSTHWYVDHLTLVFFLRCFLKIHGRRSFTKCDIVVIVFHLLIWHKFFRAVVRLISLIWEIIFALVFILSLIIYNGLPSERVDLLIDVDLLTILVLDITCMMLVMV